MSTSKALPHDCAVCSRQTTVVCSKCRDVYYCSTRCQKLVRRLKPTRSSELTRSRVLTSSTLLTDSSAERTFQVSSFLLSRLMNLNNSTNTSTTFSLMVHNVTLGISEKISFSISLKLVSITVIGNKSSLSFPLLPVVA